MNNATSRTPLRVVTLFALALLSTFNFQLSTAHAASHTWSGAVSGYFSNPGNWSAGGVPTLAETNQFVFPAGPTRLTITNDIGPLLVSSFTFNGSTYVVRGASAFNIRFSAININCNNSNTIEAPIDSDIPLITSVGAGESLVLSGSLSGTGGLTKYGAGHVYLRGASANTFSGDTVVNDGTMVLNKPNGVQAVANLTVNHPGKVVWAGNEQIADAATFSLLSSVSAITTNAILTGHEETLTRLNLRNGRVVGGTFGLLGDIDLTNPEINDSLSYLRTQIRLSPGTHLIRNANSNPANGDALLFLHDSIQENGGTAGLTTSNCLVRLVGSNSFTGPVVVNRGDLTVGHPYALGGTAQGTFLTNSASLTLSMPQGSILGGESLDVAPPGAGLSFSSHIGGFGDDHVTNTWAGPVTVHGDHRFDIGQFAALIIDGPVRGTYPLTMDGGGGKLILTGDETNTITGLWLHRGTLRLAKSAGVPAFSTDVQMFGNNIDPVGVRVILDAPDQFAPETVIVIGSGNTNAVFSLNGQTATVGGITGSGRLDIANGTLTVRSLPGTRNFLGVTTAAPLGTRLIKQGTGNQGLFGTNFFSGAGVAVQSGILGVSGGAFGSVHIVAGGSFEKNGGDAQIGTLSGTGNLSVNTARVLVGGNNTSSQFTGTIQGLAAAQILKVGTGALTFSGTSAFPGQMLLQNGALLVNGSYTGLIRVEAGAPGQLPLLGGTGTLGNVLVLGTGARISPGATTNLPSYGKLSVSSIALDGGAFYACEIGGTNVGANLDQIDARDTTTLHAGAAASFTAYGAGAVGNRYAVWKSFAPVNGTFQGKSEGSTIFPAAGRSMRINYQTGTANREIALTDLIAIPPSTISNIERQPDGTFQINGQGTSGVMFEVQANADLNTTNWVTIGTATGNFNGALQFIDASQARFAKRFYRFLLP